MSGGQCERANVAKTIINKPFRWKLHAHCSAMQRDIMHYFQHRYLTFASCQCHTISCPFKRYLTAFHPTFNAPFWLTQTPWLVKCTVCKHCAWRFCPHFREPSCLQMHLVLEHNENKERNTKNHVCEEAHQGTCNTVCWQYDTVTTTTQTKMETERNKNRSQTRTVIENLRVQSTAIWKRSRKRRVQS